jgi:hypothetical protein
MVSERDPEGGPGLPGGTEGQRGLTLCQDCPAALHSSALFWSADKNPCVACAARQVRQVIRNTLRETMERLTRLLRRLFPSLTRARLPGGSASWSPKTNRPPTRGRGRSCGEYRAYLCNMNSMNSVTGHMKRPEQMQKFLAKSWA